MSYFISFCIAKSVAGKEVNMVHYACIAFKNIVRKTKDFSTTCIRILLQLPVLLKKTFLFVKCYVKHLTAGISGILQHYNSLESIKGFGKNIMVVLTL